MNADPAELEKFSQLAHRWWDPQGEFRPLHDINPLRLDWIDERAGLTGKRVLDVGCGGGILAEAMAGRGAEVTGIDLSEKSLRVAELHLLQSKARVTAGGTGPSPRSVRRRFSARARSGAVSASVPSRSNSTARMRPVKPRPSSCTRGS